MGDLLRPAPRRSPLEHVVAVARWIGIGRIVAVVVSALGVAAGAFWLLRTPPSADPDRAAPSVSVAPPTVPGAGGPHASLDGPPCDVTPDPAACVAACASGPPGQCSVPSSTTAPSTTSAASLVVHVAGAVASPGVIELPAGSRVGDAIAAAGGATVDAATDAVNLAALVTDAQQVYVPHLGEADGPAPDPAPPAGSGAPAAGPLDLNTATEQQLVDLPGVGPVLAAAIVRHREEAGPFTAVDGLLEVSGIGPARLESLRDLVRV